MNNKIGNDQIEYADNLVSKLSIDELRSYDRYAKRSSYFSNLMLAAVLAGAFVSNGGLLERHSIEKHKPIGVVRYEEADHKLDSARTVFYDEIMAKTPRSFDKSWKLSELEDIAALQSEEANLYNSKVNQDYNARLRNADKMIFYGIVSGLFASGIFAGIKSYYDSKKQKIIHRKMSQLKVVK
jgi:hypothetical protein